MLVKDFITRGIPVLKSFDTGDYTLSLMNAFKVKQLPLGGNSLYKTLISEKDLPALDNPFIPLQNLFQKNKKAPSISPELPILDALSLIVRLLLNLQPVCNSKGEYQGSVTMKTLSKELSGLCGAETPRSIIVLELRAGYYVLSDIISILESNQTNLLSMLTKSQNDAGKIQLLLKIDIEDASTVIRSFERFNYTVLYYFMKQGVIDDLLQRRVNKLFFYMNI